MLEAYKVQILAFTGWVSKGKGKGTGFKSSYRQAYSADSADCTHAEYLAGYLALKRVQK